jgi:aconitate hydratase
MYLGVRAVFVKSFARIHKANLVNYGILPLVLEDPSAYDRVSQGDELLISNIRAALETGSPFTVTRKKDGSSFIAKNELDGRSRKILLSGGLAAYTRAGGQ